MQTSVIIISYTYTVPQYMLPILLIWQMRMYIKFKLEAGLRYDTTQDLRGNTPMYVGIDWGFILASCERNGKTPLIVGAGVTPGDCVAESPVTVSHSSSSTGCV